MKIADSLQNADQARLCCLLNFRLEWRCQWSASIQYMSKDESSDLVSLKYLHIDDKVLIHRDTEELEQQASLQPYASITFYLNHEC